MEVFGKKINLLANFTCFVERGKQILINLNEFSYPVKDDKTRAADLFKFESQRAAYG